MITPSIEPFCLVNATVIGQERGCPEVCVCTYVASMMGNKIRVIQYPLSVLPDVAFTYKPNSFKVYFLDRESEYEGGIHDNVSKIWIDCKLQLIAHIDAKLVQFAHLHNVFVNDENVW